GGASSTSMLPARRLVPAGAADGEACRSARSEGGWAAAVCTGAGAAAGAAGAGAARSPAAALGRRGLGGAGGGGAGSGGGGWGGGWGSAVWGVAALDTGAGAVAADASCGKVIVRACDVRSIWGTAPCLRSKTTRATPLGPGLNCATRTRLTTPPWTVRVERGLR